MANRRWGFHSGKLTCYDLEVANDLEIKGDLAFGDASTDTFTVTGKLDANGNVDLGSGDDTINIGSGSGDTVNIKENATFATSKKLYFRDTGLYINSGADGKLTISADGTGADDITLDGTVTASDHITVSTDKKLYFRDTGLYINSSADGQLDIVADTTITLSGAITADSSIELTGADSDNTITWSGTNTAATPALKFPDDTYIADADGAVGAEAGFIVVDIGGTNYKLRTYAMS